MSTGSDGVGVLAIAFDAFPILIHAVASAAYRAITRNPGARLIPREFSARIQFRDAPESGQLGWIAARSSKPGSLRGISSSSPDATMGRRGSPAY